MNGGGKRIKGEADDGSMGFPGDFPEELLVEIFTRLEPWWFFRCSSVVKNWRDVITREDLLSQRHEHQHLRPIILYMTKDEKLRSSNDVPSFKLETFDLQARKSCLIANFSGATVTKKYSFQMFDCFKVHGSCRGVLLMSFHEHLYLCNPMTRCWSRFDYVRRAGDNSQQLIPLRLVFKESLLSHRRLPHRYDGYDVENLEPPFFDNLASSDTKLREI